MLTALVLGVSLVATGCVGSPPPGSTKRVLIFGDSNAWGIGCVLGDQGTLPPGTSSGFSCTSEPGITGVNQTAGACAIAGGTTLLYDQLDHAAFGPLVGDDVLVGSCADWQTAWPTVLDQQQPDLVILSTGGWEITDRWDPFPAGGACTAQEAFNCPAPNYRWSDASGTGAARYRSMLEAAIQLIRSKGAEVLVVNAPYYAPDEPQVPGVDIVWYEPYPAVNPVGPTPQPWETPNANVAYRSSKAKIDEFNAIIDAVQAEVYPNDPSVQFFDLWSRFSPVDPATGDREYSDVLCPAPNEASWPTTCPGTAILARSSFDRIHLTEPAYRQILMPYLLPVIRQMLG